jgi:hypothetical protein
VGEANAWPHERARGGPPYPHELVHWLALRVGASAKESEHFEALLAPRAPLSRSPLVHARLSEAELRAGLALPRFMDDWHTFVQPGDVVCSWGHYGPDLLRREGASLPERYLDVRKIAGDDFKRQPGSLEQLVAELALPWLARGRGRGGERLGMLEALVRFLARAARAPAQSEAQPDLGVDQ